LTDAIGVSASLLERSQFAVENFDFCNSLNANWKTSGINGYNKIHKLPGLDGPSRQCGQLNVVSTAVCI